MSLLSRIVGAALADIYTDTARYLPWIVHTVAAQ